MDEKQQVLGKETCVTEIRLLIGILVIGEDTCTGLYRGCSKLATGNQSVQQYHHRELGLVYQKLVIECQGFIFHYMI